MKGKVQLRNSYARSMLSQHELKSNRENLALHASGTDEDGRPENSVELEGWPENSVSLIVFHFYDNGLWGPDRYKPRISWSSKNLARGRQS